MAQRVITVNSKERLAILAVALACVIWGGSFLFGKVALREMPASHVVLGRFLMASILLAPSLKRMRSTFQMKDLPLFTLSGVLMVPTMMLLQFAGLALTSMTSAALIIGMIPVLMALAAVLFDGERPMWRGWLAVILSTLGAVFLVGSPTPGRTMIGDLLVFASAVASVVWVLTARRIVARHDSLASTALMIQLGTLTLMPISFAMDGLPTFDYSASTWLAMAVLGIGCTAITYSLWNWGLKVISASQAGVFVNLEPLVGATLGIIVLHESLTSGLLLGGLLILTAAFLTTTEKAVG